MQIISILLIATVSTLDAINIHVNLSIETAPTVLPIVILCYALYLSYKK